MLTRPVWLAFVALCTAMTLSPGPNATYPVSRSICQGARAGLVSPAGVAAGFVAWMLLAVFGISAMLVALPFAYDALRIAAAVYLGWLVLRAPRTPPRPARRSSSRWARPAPVRTRTARNTCSSIAFPHASTCLPN